MAYRQCSARVRPGPGPSRGAAQLRADVRVSPGYHDRPPRPAQRLAPACKICSYRQPVNEKAAAVRHKHFSTRYMMNMSTTSQAEKYCISCKVTHIPFPTKRVKLCMSDSTLHMFFAPPESAQLNKQYKGDKVHTEYVTIPGGKIEDLQQAFRLEYEEKETRGIDVLVVAGLNNILKGDRMEELMHKFGMFRDIVMRQARKYHPETQNTFAVATVLYAPQLCWFPDTSQHPNPDYKNRLEELQWLNTSLLRFNQDMGIKGVPHVHKFGARVDNKSSKDLYGNVRVHHKVTHRWEQWREKEKDRMLHLEDGKRIDLGRSVNKYFEYNT